MLLWPRIRPHETSAGSKASRTLRHLWYNENVLAWRHRPVRVRPRVGLMLVFDTACLHRVQPVHGQRPRISWQFAYGIQGRGPVPRREDPGVLRVHRT